MPTTVSPVPGAEESPTHQSVAPSSPGSSDRGCEARGLSNSSGQRAEDWTWIGLLVLGAVFRVWVLAHLGGPMDNVFSDPERHFYNARNFWEPDPMGCSNPFFYQLFLHIVLRLTHETDDGTLLVNAALSILYPFVWYRFAKTVMKKRINALRFAVVLSFIPTHACIYQFFMNETVMLPLIGASLWATSVAAKRRSAPLFILAAGLWTCTLLTRSIALPLAVFALSYCLFRQLHSKLSTVVWRAILSVSAGAIAGSGLWIAAQHSVRILEYPTAFGDNLPASIYMVSDAVAFETTYVKPDYYEYSYSFASPSFYVSPFYPLSDYHSIREGTLSYVANVEMKGRDLRELFWKQLALHAKLLPRLVWENWTYLSFGHSWPESGPDTVMGLVCLHERWIWLPIMLSSVIGSSWFFIRRRVFYLVPALGIFAVALLYGSQFVVMEGRYRKPVEPLAVLALFWLADSSGASRRRPASVPPSPS